MNRKLLFIILMTLFSCASLFAQDTTSIYEEEVEIEDDVNEEEELENEADTTIKSDSTKNLNNDEASFKPQRKGNGKFLRLFEHFHFNAISGLGVTQWRSQYINFSDTAKVRYKGFGKNVPIHIQILFDIWKIRIGGGAAFELYTMKNLHPNKYKDALPTYETGGIGSFKKFYGHLGYEYFYNKMYTYIADVEVGMCKISPAYNTAGSGYKPFINIGISLERKYSELFRVFLKPSLEYKGQPYNLPNEALATVKHRQITFYALCGISYSIPTLAKCPVKSCGIRIHHYHKDREFRGNPFQRLQNPNYGEEDRKFIKMRGKNKKKLNAY